ncbi:MAG: hypothetical protein HRU13_04360 [Phycisphaerales bacterium]|nr:hypothetical protein [Phycisphaerales bacterium]
MIWFKLYGTGDSPFSGKLIKSVTQLMVAHFKLRSPSGGIDGEKWRIVPDIAAWINDATVRQDERYATQYEVAGGISLGGPADRANTSWVMYSNFVSQDATFEPPEGACEDEWIDSMHGSDACRNMPSLLVGVQSKLLHNERGGIEFVEALCDLVLANNEWWYGFIDARPDAEIPIPPYYLYNSLDNPGNWDLLANQEWWTYFGLAHRSVVRNLYWGNFLGPKMRDAMEKAGSIEFTREATRGNYGPWPEVTLGDHGMFIRLSEDPVWHEKHKHELTSGPDPTGRAAAIFKEALSRASLL